MAIYYKKNSFVGSLQSLGGLGARESGAAGTSYLAQRSNETGVYGVLKVNNDNRRPSTERINQVVRLCYLTKQ